MSTSRLSIVLICGLTACRSDRPSDATLPGTQGVLPAAATQAQASPTRTLATPPPPLVDGTLTAELGELAPDFVLPDLDGRRVKLSNFRGKIVVLEWFDPDCEYVRYAYDEGPLTQMHERHARRGIVWFAIHSGAVADTEATAAKCREFLAARQLRTPILLDARGLVGRSYGARTSPQVFVVNERGVLVYRGAVDNAPLGRVESTVSKVNFLEAAIADLKSGHAITTSETKPYGCSIPYGKP